MNHIGISLKDNEHGIQDIFLDETGNLAMTHDAEAVAQHAKQRIMTFEGEWFLNSNVGVPWLSDIFAQAFDSTLSEAIIKSTIQKTDGVTEIVSFSVNFGRTIRNLKSSGIVVQTIYDKEAQL